MHHSPARHRSTTIDVCADGLPRVLPGCTGAHARARAAKLRAPPPPAARCRAPLGGGGWAPASPAAAAAGASAASAALPEPPPASLYASSFCAAPPPGALLQAAPCRLAAVRRTLEASSEWAALSQHEQELAAQEVGERGSWWG